MVTVASWLLTLQNHSSKWWIISVGFKTASPTQTHKLLLVDSNALQNHELQIIWNPSLKVYIRLLLLMVRHIKNFVVILERKQVRNPLSDSLISKKAQSLSKALFGIALFKDCKF